MDDLLTIAKVLGAAGGGTALLAWVMTRPHVIDAFKHSTDWWLRRGDQEAALQAARIKRLIEQEALLTQARDALLERLNKDVAELRIEVRELHAELTALSEIERDCREELSNLRAHAFDAKQAGEDSAALMQAIKGVHPEWFGPERRYDGRRATDKKKEPLP